MNYFRMLLFLIKIECNNKKDVYFYYSKLIFNNINPIMPNIMSVFYNFSKLNFDRKFILSKK